MTPDTIIAFVDAAAALLSLAALALGFYVKAKSEDVVDKRVAALDRTYQAKIEALRSENAAECKGLGAGIDALRAQQDAKADALAKAVYERITNFGDRLQHLEGRVDDMPRREDVFKVSLQLQGMAGDLKAITAQMASLEQNSKANREAVARIENHIFKIET
jgi:hypothetical protein